LQQAPTLPINKEVLTSILPSFPHKPVEEPAPVVSAVLTGQWNKKTEVFENALERVCLKPGI